MHILIVYNPCFVSVYMFFTSDDQYCKWTNEKVDVGVLETLLKRSQLFHYKQTQLYLFAKRGFTKGCADMANSMENVTLVTYTDIMKRS